MKKIKYCFGFCIIAILFFSCAPSPENASAALRSENYILLGFWHGIIVPFAALGKLLGLNIGLYDAGKDVFSYWLGYFIALMFYWRIIRFIWVQTRLEKEQ